MSRIFEYFKETHKFQNREELKKAGVTDKAFEQSIGFLRIPDSNNPLDRTRIHPESYSSAMKILKECNLNLADFGKDEFNDTIKKLNVDEISKKLDIDRFTTQDIIDELQQPFKDVRDDVNPPVLRDDVLELKDLHPGMQLTGTVRNVTSFGAYYYCPYER